MGHRDRLPALIFDFDGTLADSFELSLKLFYELTHRRPLPAEDISRLRGLDIVPLLRELHIPMWQIPLLLWRVRRRFGTVLEKVDLFPGMQEAIRLLAQRHRLYVLSSNSADNVRGVLMRIGIDGYFAGIYGAARPLHKERGLRNILRRSGVKPQDAWYIGDEARDVDAAHRIGLRAVAVSWGYNNIAVLGQHHPEVLVFSPEELITRFDKERAHA